MRQTDDRGYRLRFETRSLREIGTRLRQLSLRGEEVASGGVSCCELRIEPNRFVEVA
jgi:hypothetical protein